VPVISWAGAGRATNITAAAVSSDKPLWINFRFIVFRVLVFLGIGRSQSRFIEAQRGRDEAAITASLIGAFGNYRYCRN